MNQSSAFQTGHSIGTVVAYVIIYGGILAAGVYFSRRLTRKKDAGAVVRWPIGVAFALVLLLLVGQCSNRSEAQSAPVTSKQDVVIEQRIAGDSSRFPSEFTADFIRLYDQGLHDGLAASIGQREPSIPLGSLITSTVALDLMSHKVLKSKAEVPSRLFLYQYTGTAAGKVVVVICTSRTAKPFETAGTDCEKTAAKVFGA